MRVNVYEEAGFNGSTMSEYDVSGELFIPTRYVDDYVLTSIINYDLASKYLLREWKIVLKNSTGKYSFEFGNKFKMTFSGTKYVGIQQDSMKITISNVNLLDFANAINNGCIYLDVIYNGIIMFTGMIKAINNKKSNVVERTIEITALVKTIEMLNSLVSPISLNSTMNYYDIINRLTSGRIATDLTTKVLLERQYSGNEFLIEGSRSDAINEIMKILNDAYQKNNPGTYVAYSYDETGLLNIFSNESSSKLPYLYIKPETGMIDFPSITTDGVEFTHVFNTQYIVPGRRIKLDNNLFSVEGSGDTAFLWTFDPNGFYIITKVTYNFSTLPNNYTCNVSCFPESKYRDYIA